jgi:hypothetical protein
VTIETGFRELEQRRRRAETVTLAKLSLASLPTG